MAAQYDLNIEKGSIFEFWFKYLTDEDIPVNLSGYNAQMQIKRFKGADLPLLYTDINGTTYGYTLSMSLGQTGNGKIYLNTNFDNSYADGGVKINLGPDITSNLDQGKYFYDIKLFAGSGLTFAQRLLEGRITVDESVS